MAEEHLHNLFGLVEDDNLPTGHEIKAVDRYRSTITLKAEQLFRKINGLFWLVRYDRGRLKKKGANGKERSYFRYGIRTAFRKNPVVVYVCFGGHLVLEIARLQRVVCLKDRPGRSDWCQAYFTIPFGKLTRGVEWREGVLRHPDIDPAQLDDVVGIGSLFRDDDIPF